MDGSPQQSSIIDIPTVLAHYATWQPDAPAILAPGRKPLSFAALHGQQIDVQQVLCGWGFRPGDPVALLLPKGPEMAVASAVLPASTTVIPLDPSLSADDYESLFCRCGARGLIAQEGIRHAARDAAERKGLRQIDLVPNRHAAAGKFDLVARKPTLAINSGRNVGVEIAYILTSSGTSARRKLIPYTHDHMVRYALAMKDWFDYVPTDTSLHLVPMHFAHGIKFVLMGALLLGTSVVCPTAYSSGGFFSMLDEFRPTLTSAGFTVYRDVLRHLGENPSAVAKSSFRFLRVTSGRLEPEEIIRLEEAFDTPVTVGFSSAETGIITNSPLPPRANKLGSAGLPSINDVTIRDTQGKAVGIHREGEICVRGPLVFHGYLDDADATRSAFDDGWYRTGDLGKFDEDGFLYLTGRISDVINSGGEKISPAEIDSQLVSHPDIKEAAAFALPHRTLGQVVVAAVVLADGKTENETAIKQYLRRTLSRSKIPRRLYFVDHLPRTGNGKLQRRKLPQFIGPKRTNVPANAVPTP